MNAGIVILPDGVTPCLAYDEPLPYAVKAIEFTRENYLLTLVYDVPRRRGSSKFNSPKQGKTFEFPLDRRFADIIMRDGVMALARMKDGQLVDLQTFPVVTL